MLPVIFAIASAAAASTGTYLFMENRYERVIAEQREAQSALLADAHANAQRETKRIQAAADEAQKLAEVRLTAMARSVAAVRNERDGLRDELANYRSALPDASCASVREHAAALNTVFGLCADRLERLAREAQGHAVDSLKLQEAWPTGAQ